MSDKQRFILISPRVRSNAILAVKEARDGYTVTVAPPTRSLDQNAKLHAICADLAASPMQWFGRRRGADEWKVLLVSGHTKATQGEVDIVPGIEGEMVNVRESTARMSVARASSLLEYAIAFCASHGVELHETKRGGFIADATEANARAA